MPRARTILLSKHTRHRPATLSKCGVYIITNTTNGKFYIGSTSVSFAYRWERHVGELRDGISSCTALQKAVNRYGLENFEFSILRTCLPEDALRFEQAYLDELEPWKPSKGYNCGRVAHASFYGRKHTPEARELMRQRQLGKKHNEATKQKMRAAKLGTIRSQEFKVTVSRKARRRFRNGEQIPVVGEQNGKSVLTTKQVKRIDRELRAGKLTITEIAKREGRGFNTIKGIETGRTWGWLTGRGA